jgi:hypothetical protein
VQRSTKLNLVLTAGKVKGRTVVYKNEVGTLLFEMANSFGAAAGNFGSGATRSVGASYHPGPADIGACTAIGISSSVRLMSVTAIT